MERIAVSEAREQISEILNRVAYCGERVVLHRRGKEIAALVPMSDLRALLQAAGDTAGAIGDGAADSEAEGVPGAPAGDGSGDPFEDAADAIPSGRLVDDSDASPWIPRAL
jgi:prevent-host-death family protein